MNVNYVCERYVLFVQLCMIMIETLMHLHIDASVRQMRFYLLSE